jgi:hypothetical protein
MFSSLSSHFQTASLAVDGDEVSSWRPSAEGAQLGNPYWLSVDLGQAYDLCRMEVKVQYDEGQLLVHSSLDSLTWTLIKQWSVQNFEWEGFEWPAGSKARWVRLYNKHRLSISEVEIYRLQDMTLQSSITHECLNGTHASSVTCCQACLECTDMACANNITNCTNFLSETYSECVQVSEVDMTCCYTLWWIFATAGFAALACCCVVCCCMKKYFRRDHIQRPPKPSAAAIAEYKVAEYGSENAHVT